MAEFNGKFTEEDLAKDTVTKKDIVKAIREHATDEFVITHKLAGALKNVTKQKTKHAIVADYKLLYETKDFNPDGKKASLEATAKRSTKGEDLNQETDIKGVGSAQKDGGTSRDAESARNKTSVGTDTKTDMDDDASTMEASTPRPPSVEPSLASIILPTDTDTTLDQETRERINSNRVYISQNIQLAPCLDFLQSRGLVDTDTYDKLNSKRSEPREQTDEFLWFVGRSTRRFKAFILSLRQTNQHAIAEKMVSTDTSVLVRQGERGLLTKIKDRHHVFIKNLRFEDLFLKRLEMRDVITSEQYEELSHIPTRHERAQTLLRILEKGETPERTQGLVSALHETDQRHIALLVESQDDSEIIPGHLKTNVDPLGIIAAVGKQVKNTSLQTVLSSLQQRKMITSGQREVIQAGSNPDDQYQQLVDMITCRPLSVLKDNLLTDTSTKQVTFQLPAVEGATGADKGRPQCNSKYLLGLREGHRSSQLQLNAKLNRRFGIDCNVHPFYIRLSMGHSFSRHDKVEMEEYIRRTAEKVERRGDINITQIFSPVRGSASSPNTVLLLGGAGTGKSTVTQQLAFGWANGEIMADKIQAAYHYECRQFTSRIREKQKVSLADLVLNMHVPVSVNKAENPNFMKYLIDNQAEVQLTFDGLDELAKWGECGAESTPKITDPQEEAEIQDIIYNVIQRNLLPNAKVFVTSRPISTVSERDFDRCIVALGFSQESIRQCMSELCKGDTDKCDKIMSYLLNNPDLHALCVVPLNCVWLGCLLHHDLFVTGTSPEFVTIDSKTRLNIRVVLDDVWKRVKTQKSRYLLTDEQKECLRNLARLAADGMFAGNTKIIFDDNDFHRLNMVPDNEFFGLLEVSNDESVVTDLSYTASFLHLTVEEFFAAVHLALTWDSSLLERLTEAGSQRLDMTAMFVCGLLGDPEGRRFLRAICPTVSDQAATERVQELLSKVLPGGGKLDCLQILRCVAEGKLADLIPSVEGRILKGGKLDLSDFPGGLLPHHLSAVGYGLQATQVTELMLDSCQISTQGIQALERRSPNLKSLRNLFLGSNDISDTGVAHLARVVKDLPGLATLNLGGNKISDRGVKILAGAVKDHPGIQDIYLEVNNISNRGAHLLGAVLRHNTRICNINVQYNTLSEECKTGLKTEFEDRISV